MNALSTIRRNFVIDDRAIALAVIFVTVSVFSIMVAAQLHAMTVAPNTDPTPDPVKDDQTGKINAAGGGIWALVEVLIAAAIVVALGLYTRSPDWLRTSVRRGLFFFAFAFVGGVLQAIGIFWDAIPVLMVGYIAARGLDRLGVYWFLNNVLSVALAVIVAVIISLWFTPVAIAIGLLLLTVYDHFFANEKEWMGQMAIPPIKYKIPIMFLLPGSLRVQWQEFVDGVTDPSDDGPRHHGLGTADMALPAALATAVATGTPTTSTLVAASGIVIGAAVAAFRLRWWMDEKGDKKAGAGLPSITSGVIGGWLLIQAPIILLGI